jgi:hypothetical protein
MLRITSRIILLLVPFVLLSRTAQAATTNIDVTIVATANGTAASGVNNNQIIDVAGNDATLTIKCPDDATCAPIAARVNGASLTLTGSSTKTATISAASVSAAGTNVVIRDGTKKLLAFQLINGNTTAAPSSNTTGARTGTTNACIPAPLANSYDQARNVAHFVVTPGGSILQYPDGLVDENDVVVVHVFGPDDVVDNIEAARTSATRTTGALSVIGAGEAPDLTRFSAGELVCIERQFTLGDFAPGEATVEMYTVANATKTTLGTFKFNVNRLYDGIFSFGPVWTRQPGDMSFTLAPSGAGNVIVASEEKRRNIIYAVNYTYYAWGKRDTEKNYIWYEHLNPTLGFSIKNLSDHALAGVTADLGQFMITSGIHFAHVTRLSSASGLQLGSVFAGTVAEIPTAKRWEKHVFIGVSADLRAVTALLKTIGTAK